MNISFILPGRGRSGGVKCTVTAANGLIRRGHNVRLLVYKGRLIPRLRNLYLACRYPGNSDWLKVFEGRVDFFSDITGCALDDSEILIAAGGSAALEMARLNIPWLKKVHYVHGVDSQDPQKLKYIWRENVPMMAVSSRMAKLIGDVGKKAAAVIPNGIDTAEFFPSLPDDKRDGVGTIFGCSYQKDPDTILSVLELLEKQYPSVPRYVFGGCRRNSRIPRRMYKRLPTIGQARDIYSRSKVWFLASRSEGFPAPVLEAMACGCAVVATDCGGPIDIINDGENGFLAAVGDTAGMAKKIKLLLEDDELRRKFVLKSRDTVRKFSWANSVDKLERFLLSVSVSGSRTFN